MSEPECLSTHLGSALRSAEKPVAAANSHENALTLADKALRADGALREYEMRLKALAASAAMALASAAALAQDAPPASANDEIVVPGQVEVPAPTPPGDPRTRAQRMRDIRAWDRCLIRAQAVADSDPTRFQAETPEDYCRESLGMAHRTAVPVSHED